MVFPMFINKKDMIYQTTDIKLLSKLILNVVGKNFEKLNEEYLDYITDKENQFSKTFLLNKWRIFSQPCLKMLDLNDR